MVLAASSLENLRQLPIAYSHGKRRANRLLGIFPLHEITQKKGKLAQGQKRFPRGRPAIFLRLATHPFQ